MPVASNWPLGDGATRFFVPLFATEQLANHALTEHLFLEGFGYYPSAKGHEMARQHHDDYLLLYCTKGKGFLKIQSGKYRVKAGDLVVLSKGEAHKYYSDKDDPWTLYWVHFNGLSAEQYLDHIGLPNKACVFPLGLHSKLISDFETLLNIQTTGHQFSRFVYGSNLLAQMLTYIAITAPSAKGHLAQDSDIGRAQALMEENIAGQLDLDVLASSVNLSKYHFSTKYKDVTGYSPIQHFIMLKMEKACYLLDITSRSINQISDDLGFDDAQYFSRQFKKVIGVSPREYRKMGYKN